MSQLNDYKTKRIVTDKFIVFTYTGITKYTLINCQIL